MYQCVTCHGDFIVESPSIIICQQCKTSYPIINRISVFIPSNPISALQGFIMEMEETKSSFAKIIENLENFKRYSDVGILVDRIAMIEEGITCNTKVLQETYQPIIDFLGNQTVLDNALAWGSVKSGFTFHDMLPYFYQDWFGTPDFAEVKNLFATTIAQHCKDRESVAVLGAGACGLLYTIANDFQVSYGVDLSLPTLLTAKRFIEGKPLIYHMPKANWQQVKLEAPTPAKGDIRYLVSDVMNMPFKSASLSLVITQFMLDIASNPKRLAAEIHRVLKADGLWINFSNPFRVLDDPFELGKRKINELPGFFEEIGFDTLAMQVERFSLLNLEKISSETENNKQPVHFITLKKSDNFPIRFNEDKSIWRFFENNNEIWCLIPSIVKGRELTFVRKTTFYEQGCNHDCIEINIVKHSFSIPNDFALLLKLLFDHVDGKCNLRNLYNELQVQGSRISEASFLQLIFILNVQHYLIELKERS